MKNTILPTLNVILKLFSQVLDIQVKRRRVCSSIDHEIWLNFCSTKASRLQFWFIKEIPSFIQYLNLVSFQFSSWEKKNVPFLETRPYNWAIALLTFSISVWFNTLSDLTIKPQPSFLSFHLYYTPY